MYRGNFHTFLSKFLSKVNQRNGYFAILMSQVNDDFELGSEFDGKPMVKNYYL